MKRNFFVLFCIIYIAWIFGFSLRPNSNSQVVDVWIQNGIVLDGLGKPPERADIFLPIGTVEFKGEIFDAPNDPEAVCEARYGSDWNIPNAAFEW